LGPPYERTVERLDDGGRSSGDAEIGAWERRPSGFAKHSAIGAWWAASPVKEEALLSDAVRHLLVTVQPISAYAWIFTAMKGRKAAAGCPRSLGQRPRANFGAEQVNSASCP
jgi:hypothetical protein